MSVLLDVLIVGSFMATQKVPVGGNENYNKAFRSATLAYYHQSGRINTYREVVGEYKDVYKATTTRQQRKILTWAFLSAKTLQDKKIVYIWEF